MFALREEAREQRENRNYVSTQKAANQVGERTCGNATAAVLQAARDVRRAAWNWRGQQRRGTNRVVAGGAGSKVKKVARVAGAMGTIQLLVHIGSVAGRTAGRRQIYSKAAGAEVANAAAADALLQQQAA